MFLRFALPILTLTHPDKYKSFINHINDKNLVFKNTSFCLQSYAWRMASSRRLILKFDFGFDLIQSIEKLSLAFRKGLLFFRLSFRFMMLSVLFLPVAITFPFWYFISLKKLDSQKSEEKSQLPLWWLHYLVWTLEQSGPTFIKVGQWASSRTDLFPAWICDVLSKLQDNVYPHSFSYTKWRIESAFNSKLGDLFEFFDPNPIGVGAVAQVYKAKLKNTNVDGYVAIKVLHPNVRELVHLDLNIMQSVAKLIEFSIPETHWLSLPDEVVIFGDMMKQQLNLENEGKNLLKFAENFKHWSSVGFPEPLLSGYSNDDILIENWVNGVPMQKFLSWNQNIFDREIASIGLTSFLKMLILDNHLHADLHPGNILVSFADSEGCFISAHEIAKLSAINDRSVWLSELETLYREKYTPFVYYLDAGLTCSLSPQDLTNFIDLFKAITDFDGNLISSLMVKRSKTPWTVVNFDDFSKSMNIFMAKIRRNTFSLKHMEVSDILRFVFNTVRNYHVKIDGEFANIGVAIMLMEGVGKKLEPDMDLLRAAVPFLSQAIKLRIRNVL